MGKADRHDISLKGETHQKTKEYATARGLALNALLEVWIHDRLDREGQPLVERPENGR